MSHKTLPEFIDPFRFAEQNLSLVGEIKLAILPRLSANVNAGDDIVSAELNFGVDEQNITFVNGHLSTKLALTCQRCMEPYIYEIISDFHLGIVNDLEAVNALPEYYEPVMTHEGMLAVRELIEDELILSLPIIPRHEPQECKVKLPLHDSGWAEENEESPFRVLKSLKDKKKSEKSKKTSE